MRRLLENFGPIRKKTHFFWRYLVVIFKLGLLFTLNFSVFAGQYQPEWAEEPVFISLEPLKKSFPESVTQDQLGYLWIGTQTGLYRYDGYNLTSFVPDPDNLNSLSGSSVNALAVSKNNSLWIGTEYNGVSVYDPHTETFRRYQHDPNNTNSLPSDKTHALLLDKKGGIWVGTLKGLCRIDELTGQIEIFKHSPKSKEKQKTGKIQNNNSIYSLYLDNNDILWVGHDLGLSQLDISAKEIGTKEIGTKKVGTKEITNRNLKPINLYHADGKFWQDRINTIFQSNDGQLWLGTDKNGLAKLSRDDNRLQFYPIDQEKSYALKHPRVFDIINIGTELWVATYGGGISIIDIPSQKLLRTIKASAEHNDSGESTVSNFFIDQSGLLWISSMAGLFKYNPDASTFTLLRHRANNPKTLSSNNITSIYERSNGNIWVSLNGNGIDILNQNFARIKSLKPNENKTNWFNHDLSDIAEDQQGTIWLASYGGGLFNYIKKNDQFIQYTQGLLSLKINIIQVQDNILWMGTNKGLNYIDLKTKTISSMTSVKGTNIPAQNRIFDLAIHPDQSLWIASTNGIYVVPKGATELIHLTPKDSKHLAKTIIDIEFDLQGRLWFGANNNITLLDKWNGKQADYHFFNMPFKPMDTANLLSDNQANLWSITGWFNTETSQLTPLTNIDGIADNVGSWAQSQAKTRDGQLLYGTMDGLIYFDPTEVKRWNYRPPVVMTQLVVDGTKQRLSPNERLTLAPESREFSIEFAALDYSNPKNNRYRYRLENYNNQWTETDSEHRVAKFMNLSPQDYRLVVQGTNRLGDWSPHELIIPVTQLPAWSQMVWFKLFVFILTMGIFYLVLEYRTRLLKQRTVILKNLVDEKIQDIKSILDAIQQGILAIEDDDGHIGPEHSKYLETLAETKDITGRSFYQLLFKNSTFNDDEKSQIMGVISASVGEEEIGFQMNSHLLPREALIEKDNVSKIYELDWNPITKNGLVTKILLVVRDVTDLRALEQASKKQRHEIDIIQEIINVPSDKFHSMMKSCYRFINENRDIINEQNSFNLEAVQHLFRNMHTMKGIAHSYSLRSLSDAAHITEQYYSHSLNSKQWNAKLMLGELDKARIIVDNYTQVDSEKLGRSSENLDVLPVKISTLERNLTVLSELDLSDFSTDKKININELKQLLTRIVRSPLEQVICDQIKSSASLARLLNKAEPLIVFQDSGFSINQSAHELINNVFTHLIRNSIDHGLESPHERKKAGKPEQGKLSFVLEEINSQLRIRFSDDGRGLNLKKIYDLAVEKGFIDKAAEISPDLVANQVFASGFSTAKHVTDISGQGVGLDAVKNFLEAENCSIEIRVVDPSIKTLIFSPVEFIITLPPKFFQFMGDT